MVPHSGARYRLRVSLRAGIMLAVAALIAMVAPGVGAMAPPHTLPKSTPLAVANKISPALLGRLKSNPSARIRYIVTLTEQANVDNDIRDWNAKGWYVLSTLKAMADRTQPPVRAFLDGQQKAGNVEKYKSYYIINGFSVTGNLASAKALAGLSHVLRIDEFPVITLDDTLVASDSQSPNTVEWNVAMVHAPQAWAMGYTGIGAVVGSLDTGVRYTHQALVGKYRGNLGGGVFDHNYNWWPAVGTSQIPEDTNGHGTHTTGTALGDDGGSNQVGVAPGARWIATNALASGADPDVIEAGQWMLAPWDLNQQNPDPTKRPHVVGNSWGYGGYSFSCSDVTFFRDVVQSWIAAGIFASFSGGSGGTSGNSHPASYPETFETGNLTNSGVRSVTSSIGPSCFDGGQLPQVMAGGNQVRSSWSGNDTQYSILTGTSMAQPAVAGAVAILHQVNPNLTIPETWYILTNTAVFSPGWGTRPNVNYGWGLLQIDAAVQAALQTGSTPTNTPTHTHPHTPTATITPTETTTATITPTPCDISFSDVQPTDYFYEAVRYLYCHGAISGYDDRTFRPYNLTTRGQLTKIVVLAEGWTIYTPPTPTFRDVPSTHAFYQYIETAYHQSIISGYRCGTNCLEFRPGATVTRGQLCKIVVLAEEWALYAPPTPTFQDVSHDDPFYAYIETAYNRNIISGYSCGTGCLEFRPSVNATRGQICKIVYLAVTGP